MKHLKPIHLLVFGTIIIALTHMRFGIGMLVFLEPIPFLFYLEKSKGFKSKSLLYLALLTGWSLATAKIITAPLPMVLSFGYGLPIALFKFLPFLVFMSLRKSRYVEWAFPAVLVIAEWIQATLTPFASWGSAAYTQINNPVWLQIVSVGGIWLLSYFIYFSSFQLYLILRNGFSESNAAKLVAPIIILVTFGSLRLSQADNKGVDTMTIAAIGTNSVIGGPEFPSATERSISRNKIYNRMIVAARSGAELVVWTEAAAGLLPDEELMFQEKVTALTDSLNITAMVCYVVPTSSTPLFYENKYILIDSSGVIQSTYNKHQPVPGEPCAPGTEPHTLYNLGGTQLGGAICYDFDFPALSREIASLGADVVAVPSSDWRGIDPIHTQMAGVRAVEGGFSLIRSTRWGLSAAIGPYGRVNGQLSDFDSEDKILVASVAKNGVQTIYRILGDWVILASIILVGIISFDVIDNLKNSSSNKREANS